jgi:hypothetical protein
MLGGDPERVLGFFLVSVLKLFDHIFSLLNDL